MPRVTIRKMGASGSIYISCGIFREELDYLIKDKGLDLHILYLDAALHVNFDKLKEELIAALEENSGKDRDLKILYGHCHPEIMEILERYHAKKIEAGNCLEALIGKDELGRLDAEAKTFFLTVGWINNWKKMFSLGKKDFGFDFKSMFENYKRIIVFDTGLLPVDEDSVREFCQFTGLPVERRSVSLDHFLDLVEKL